MVSAYTVVQRKYFLVMTPDVFFLLLHVLKKVNMIYVKIIFIFSNDGKKSSVSFFFIVLNF